MIRGVRERDQGSFALRHLIRTVVAASVAGAILALAGGAFASSHWSRVTSTPGGSTEEVSSAWTPDGTLHVVWAPAGEPGSLFATTVSPTGGVGSASPIASGWAAIGNPSIARQPAGAVAVAAAAQRSTSSTDLIQNQAFWTSADSGAHWSLYPSDIAFGSGAADPVSLVFGPDGVSPWTTWATSAGVWLHHGTDPTVPNVNLAQAAGWNCCGYDPGIAYDPAGNSLVVAWYSNATGHGGLAVQAINPLSGSPLGSPQLLPGSSSQQPGERTEIAARQGGGLYLADAGGAAATRALVWRFGAPHAVTVGSNSGGVADVGVAADPSGRLWAFWVTSPGGTSVLHARRSNPSVTMWGAEVTTPAPAGEINTWKLDGAAQTGRLDLLGLFSIGSSTATWLRQVLPGLSLSARSGHSGKLTVTVTDAGQPVAGATVRAGGASAKTNHAGIAHLRVGGRRPRTVTIVASKAGYTSARRSARLAR